MKSESLKLKEILEAVNGQFLAGAFGVEITGISIDSRTVLPGDLYVALVGKRFNGHDYVHQAIARGASAIIVSDPSGLDVSCFANKSLICVKNTLQALGDIARLHRCGFTGPVFAVTGSNGKTTTKDMLAHVLSAKLSTVKAKASFNNLIGVPLTLLRIGRDTQAVVLEMETNTPGGITRLCDIARPGVGVITNIGDTHLESLGSREGVLEEKAELIQGLPADGTVILNSDDSSTDALLDFCEARNRITFAIQNNAPFRASHIEIKESSLSFILNGQDRVKLQTGFYENVYNALAVVAVAHGILHMALSDVVHRLRIFAFPRQRMERLSLRGVVVINDTYNANPQSMEAALQSLASYRGCGRTIAVLGDMMELGPRAPEFHCCLGRSCADHNVDIVVIVGVQTAWVRQGISESDSFRGTVLACADTKSASNHLCTLVQPGDVVLVKGSRAMRMERIVQDLLKTIA